MAHVSSPAGPAPAAPRLNARNSTAALCPSTPPPPTSAPTGRGGTATGRRRRCAPRPCWGGWDAAAAAASRRRNSSAGRGAASSMPAGRCHTRAVLSEHPAAAYRPQALKATAWTRGSGPEAPADGASGRGSARGRSAP